MWALIAVSVLAGVGFLGGLARPKISATPAAVSMGVVIGYVLLLTVTGGWVTACPGCTSFVSYDSSRSLDLGVAIFWGAIFTAGIVLCTWLGAGIGALARRIARRGL